MEKCAKCKIELGWKKMHCHQIINEWLCDACFEIYPIYFEIFKKEFLSNKELNYDNDSSSHKKASESS